MPKSMFRGDNGPHLVASEPLTATRSEEPEDTADLSEIESAIPGIGAAAALSPKNGSDQ